MTMPSNWDDTYSWDRPPAWDIGRPQPVFLRLAERDLLSGRVLDSGCGTGETTLLAAAHGADAVGIDLSGRAIERARAKAAERGLAARFETGDVLRLDDLGLAFDMIVDSGVFHVFDDEDRARYVASLGSVLRPGGRCYLICFSDRQPGEFGPRRVSQDELRAAFSDGWAVASIEAEAFELNDAAFGISSAQAWLAVIQRLG
jgi:cyclopropane fatty-acyl-phospholipid synthase-like methyltransferase